MEEFVGKVREQLEKSTLMLKKLVEGFNKEIGGQLKKAKHECKLATEEKESLVGVIKKLNEDRQKLLENIESVKQEIGALKDECTKEIREAKSKMHGWVDDLAQKEKRLKNDEDRINSLQQAADIKTQSVATLLEENTLLKEQLENDIERYEILQHDEIEKKNNLVRDRKKTDELSAKVTAEKEVNDKWAHSLTLQGNDLQAREKKLAEGRAQLKEEEGELKDKETDYLLRLNGISEDEDKIKAANKDIARDRANLVAKDTNLKALEKELREKYEKK